MTTQTDFLKAIIESPDDDHLRLIAADFMEEQGDIVRAEFIRLQLALSRIPPRKKVFTFDGYRLFRFRQNEGVAGVEVAGGLYVEPGDRVDLEVHDASETPRYKRHWHGILIRNVTYNEPMRRLGRAQIEFTTDEHSRPWEGEELRKREKELLELHGRDWAEPTAKGLGCDDWSASCGCRMRYDESTQFPTWEFRRGFIERVSCRLEDWIGQTCIHCDGTGSTNTGPGDYGDEYVPCNGSTGCNGLGRTQAHGPVIVKQAPITQVIFTDRGPARIDDGRFSFYYRDNDPQVGWIPWILAGRREGHYFDTEDEAEQWLSNQAIKWARSQP